MRENNNINKRKQRKKVTAQCFTPVSLTNIIINKLIQLDHQILNYNKDILDPACGTGNLLLQVLRYRLKLNMNPLDSLRTLYGLDIMQDNIQECHQRLLQLIPQELKQQAKLILINNIIYVPQGTINYFNSDNQGIF